MKLQEDQRFDKHCQVIQVQSSCGCTPHTQITWATFLGSKTPLLKILCTVKSLLDF